MNKQTLNNQKPFTNTKLTTDTLSPARSSNSKCTKRKSTTTTKKKQKQCERKLTRGGVEPPGEEEKKRRENAEEDETEKRKTRSLASVLPLRHCGSENQHKQTCKNK